MQDTTTLACTKCKDGVLTMKWFSEGYCNHTEQGLEYDAHDWIELIGQTCNCQFDDEEVESLTGAAEKKMIDEYDAWAKTQVTEDDMTFLDIEVKDYPNPFPDISY